MFYNIEDRGYGRKWRFTAISYGRSNFYNIDYSLGNEKIRTQVFRFSADIITTEALPQDNSKFRTWLRSFLIPAVPLNTQLLLMLA